MSTPTRTLAESATLYQEFFRIAGIRQSGAPDVMLEEAILAAREDHILFPRAVRDHVIDGATTYFESIHAHGDDYLFDALDPWDAWQKFLAAPASDD